MEITNSRVVITGGAGFIGSHLVDKLLSAGNEVIVIDDFSSGSIGNLKHHRSNNKLFIEEYSILDEPKMMKLLKTARVVFHLATLNIRLSLNQPSKVHEVNVTGTLNLLKAAAAAKVERFLYCSSSEVNGTAAIVPMKELYHYNPETIYGASKLAGEYYTNVFQRSGWLSTTIARPHNTYGPREHYKGVSGEVIPRFIIWAFAGKPPIIYGNGGQTRDFTYVEETVDFIIKLMECDSAVGETFNICRGQEVTIKEIAEIISELTGLKANPIYIADRPSDVLRLYGDPTKIYELLGSKPQISIREGLRRTIKWFRENVNITDDLLSSLKPKNWAEMKVEPWLACLD